jgi:GDP-L-fucose synthase
MEAGSIPFDLTNQRVFVAGHNGMAGSAIVRRLQHECCQILTIEHRDLDLTRQSATERYFASARPDVVIIAAGRVGGIVANNTFPVEFLADNLAMELNLIRASHSAQVKKLLFLGSTCIYPKFAKQPMSEDQLLTGELESTNQWYAIAKIAGIKLCQAYRLQHGCDFISVMPTNLYGSGDNYHPEHSHVVAGLLRRFHEAKLLRSPAVVVWGTGNPRREFMFVDDFADACVFVLKHYSDPNIINIGVGHDMSIADLAHEIAAVVGYTGEILYDPSKPDGTPRKLVDVSRLQVLGWSAKTSFSEGLKQAYADFVSRSAGARKHDAFTPQQEARLA